MAYSGGGLRLKVYLFQVLGILKGKDFTMWGVRKSREICLLGIQKGFWLKYFEQMHLTVVTFNLLSSTSLTSF